ncbi:unnamed protein product, partial [Timema podura]|nr:unnamed protein product [Timema podura]
MSGNLEQQFSNLHLNNGEYQSGLRKPRPAVPPKPKKQPLVPKSYLLNTPSEPSFSTLLQGTSGSHIPANIDGATRETETPTYDNIPSSGVIAQPQALYTNVGNHLNNHHDNTYSNIGVFGT